MRHFIAGTEIGWDTETTGLNSWKGAKPFIFSFANGDGDVEVVEFPVNRKTREVQYGHKPAAYRAVKSLLEDPEVDKVGFNWKFDFRMARAAGIAVRGKKHDVMVMAKIARSDEVAYKLKPLAKKYGQFSDDDEADLKTAVKSLVPRASRLGWKVPGGVESNYWLCSRAVEIMVQSTMKLKGYLSAKPDKQLKMIEERSRQGREVKNFAIRYAGKDAERTIFLKLFYEEILRDNDLWEIYEEEMRLMDVVIAMEDRGVALSRPWVQAGIDMVTERSLELTEMVKEEIDIEFNPRSYPQKKAYFIDKLGLEPIAQTKKGNPSIDKDFYEAHAATVPVCAWMVELDRSEKAEDFFLGYLNHMDRENIVRPNFDQVAAKTLRFGCREPNFQNVPKRGRCKKCRAELKFDVLKGFKVKCKKCGHVQVLDFLMAVRRPFRPRPGKIWGLGDYKQIEARILADEADEQVLLEAFAAGRDPYEELNLAIQREAGLEIGRDIAKHIFLGKIYGLGVSEMVRTIREMGGGNMQEDDAKHIIRTFDDTFEATTDFMRRTTREVKKTGHVINRYGQRIDVDRQFPYRGVNYKIQSAAARLMKRSMMKCHNYLQAAWEGDAVLGHLIMTIHDELIFEFDDDGYFVPKMRGLKAVMEDNEGVFTVATPVDVSAVRKTWLLKEELNLCL